MKRMCMDDGEKEIEEDIIQFFEKLHPLGEQQDVLSCPYFGLIWKNYARFVRLLRSNPLYLAKAVSGLTFNDMAPVIKVIVHSLFGERFQAREELLLLQLIKVLPTFWNRLWSVFSLYLSLLKLRRPRLRYMCSVSRHWTSWSDKIHSSRNYLVRIRGTSRVLDYSWWISRSGGKHYLNSTLREPLLSITADHDLDLELDPLKVNS